MSFPTAVAGPSRLPYLARPVAAASAAARSVQVRGYARPAEPESLDGTDKDGNPVSVSMPPMGKSEIPPFDRWLKQTGVAFKQVAVGKKAKWLGGEIVSLPLGWKRLLPSSPLPLQRHD